MKKKKLKIVGIIIIILVILHTISFADVGSFDRYDSGSSWSSSSSHHSSSGGSGYSSGSGGGTWIEEIGGFFLYIVILMIVASIFIKSNQHNMTRGSNPYRTMNITPMVDVSQSHIYAEKIKEFDPNFSEEKMLSWAKDLFVKLQNAWTARDWEPMRPFETESLFEQHKSQVQGYIDTNRINVMDRIAVNYATIYRFRQEGDRDILEIALKSTMKDYIIDATTKQLLEGSKTQDRITVYKMTFERKTGVLTPEGTVEIKTTNCPNCGAPTQITSAGKCEYCGSVITTAANTWALSGLEPLRS